MQEELKEADGDNKSRPELYTMESKRSQAGFLRIIDFPGFEDYKHRPKNTELAENIKKFFLDNKDYHPHLICIFLKATDTSLSARYIFETILEFFAKNVRPNILFVITFSEFDDAPILK